MLFLLLLLLLLLLLSSSSLLLLLLLILLLLLLLLFVDLCTHILIQLRYAQWLEKLYIEITSPYKGYLQ